MKRALVSIALCLVACATAPPPVAQVMMATAQPRPNININQSDTTLRLVLAPEIQDEYTVPANRGFAAFHFTGWRTALEAGFREAFGGAFTLSQAPDAALTLTISEASGYYDATAINGYGGIAAYTSRIRYKATLSDGGGQVVKRLAGTVPGKSSVGQNVPIMAGAIEHLYEEISDKMFQAP